MRKKDIGKIILSLTMVAAMTVPAFDSPAVAADGQTPTRTQEKESGMICSLKKSTKVKAKKIGKYLVTDDQDNYYIYADKYGSYQFDIPSGYGKKVVWSSSNENVAKVSARGVVTGLKKGSVRIVLKNAKKKKKYRWTVNVRKIARSSNSAFDSFDEKAMKKFVIDTDDSNAMFAPMGLKQAVGNMSLVGNENAQSGFAKAMGYKDAEDMKRAAADFIKRAKSSNDENICMDVANSFWVNEDLQKNETAYENMKKQMSDYYSTEFFEKEQLNSNETKDRINAWAKEHTNGLIDPFLDKPFEDLCKFVSINSLYFNCKWDNDVKMKTEWNPRSFYGLSGTGQKEFFGCEEYISYGRIGKISSVRIPYSDYKYKIREEICRL